MKELKKIPKFKNENEEREFWATHDSSEYMDWSKARRGMFPRLKPSSKLISLRLPVSVLNELQAIANREDVPYQSLLKRLLKSAIVSEFKSQRKELDQPSSVHDDVLKLQITALQYQLTQAILDLQKLQVATPQKILPGNTEQSEAIPDMQRTPLQVYK